MANAKEEEYIMEGYKYFQIDGCLEVPEDFDQNKMVDEFIKLIETKGWFFGGGIIEVDEDGNLLDGHGNPIILPDED